LCAVDRLAVGDRLEVCGRRLRQRARCQADLDARSQLEGRVPSAFAEGDLLDLRAVVEAREGPTKERDASVSEDRQQLVGPRREGHEVEALAPLSVDAPREVSDEAHGVLVRADDEPAA